jgi:hypothetical protein
MSRAGRTSDSPELLPAAEFVVPWGGCEDVVGG